MMNDSRALATVKNWNIGKDNTDVFLFLLPPREYLKGEALDRFLARCYLTLEQWAQEIRATQSATPKENPPSE